jgi:predicted nucleic acid-binding protein
MIVISDTSIITNLIQLNQLSILEHLFEEIILPRQVFDELGKIPAQAELVTATSWIQVEEVKNQVLFQHLLLELDPGESAAIALAIELQADALLIDEKKGRRIAREHGLPITGLLGILIDAKNEHLVEEVKPILDALIFKQGFRISPKLYQAILKRVNE